jgi:uncharacterized membrane protein HdeD (DUF308 family)
MKTTLSLGTIPAVLLILLGVAQFAISYEPRASPADTLQMLLGVTIGAAGLILLAVILAALLIEEAINAAALASARAARSG